MENLLSAVAANPLFAYLAIFIGCLIEADLAFLAGAILATEGHLSWSILIFVGFTSVHVSDVLWYFLGRRSVETPFGRRLVARFDRYHRWLQGNFIGRYGRVALFTRYIYYVSRITPFLAGWHRLEFRRFLRIHFAANVIWVVLMGFLGYGIGTAVLAIGSRMAIRRIGYGLASISAVILVGAYFLERIFVKRLRNGNGSPKL